MLRTKNKYLRLIINALLFLLVFLTFDQVLGKVLSHFYFKSKSGADYHLTYSIDSTTADVIILGSSRASRHYIPDIIEDSLNLTCFNTGLDGNYLLNSCAIFKSIITRYYPKIVIFDLNPDELFVGTEGYDQLSSLLPYYRTKKEIRSIVNLKSKFERIKLISRIYPFNSTMLAIAEGNLLHEDIQILKGYLPLSGCLIDTTLIKIHEPDEKLDSNKIEALKVLALESKAHGIRLIFIQSPRYADVYQKTSISLLNELTNNYDAEFWNYVDTPMLRKPEYFKDRPHMNDSGAHKFTITVAKRLKETQ